MTASETPEETIKVLGEAIVPAEPDEVHLRVNHMAVRQTSQDALGNVAERSRQVDELLTELGVPKSKRSTSGVSVHEKREWANERSIHRGYEALNSILVRMEDPQVAAAVLQGAVERAQAQVEGPWWRIALDNPARAEACGEAARDARRRAEAYAEALGLRLGSVHSVVQPRGAPDSPARFAVIEQHSMARSAGGVEIESGEQDVSAAVEVTFRLEQGESYTA